MASKNREVAKWLESKEGQQWSRNQHDRIGSRDGGEGKTGVFGEMKTDFEMCEFTGRCPDHGGSR